MPPRPRFKTASELFNAFPSAVEDMDARPANQPSVEFLSRLSAGPTPEDAITFCSYLLVGREAVWWGHQCLHSAPATLSTEDWRLLGLAEDWVRRPEEDARNLALSGGMAVPTKTPGAWIALAAGWSGGSMLAPDMTPVAPPAYLTPKAVNAGVLGTLARVDRGARAATLKSFVQMGTQLATMS